MSKTWLQCENGYPLLVSFLQNMHCNILIFIFPVPCSSQWCLACPYWVACCFEKTVHGRSSIWRGYISPFIVGSYLASRPAQLDHFRDLKTKNFMIESEKMFPDGYHPREDIHKPDLTQCSSKYFIIDFGMSHQYESDNQNFKSKQKNSSDICWCMHFFLLRGGFYFWHIGQVATPGAKPHTKPLPSSMPQRQ